MTEAIHIADEIGRKRIADAVGVGVTAVSNAVVRNRFPASWFVAIEKLATEKGMNCPPELFGMKTLHSPAAGPSERAS